MRKAIQIAIPVIMVGLGLSAVSSLSYGTAKVAKETGAKCVQCHVAAGKKDLSPAGTCYKEKKDLKACNITVAAPAK